MHVTRGLELRLGGQHTPFETLTLTAARLGFVLACSALLGMHSMPFQGDESMTTSLHSIGLDAYRAGAGGSGAAGQGAGGGQGAGVRGVSSSPPAGQVRPSGC